MPRVAEDRLPAEPMSPVQKERHRRILRAAARHGSEKSLERVQMHDVARDSGVAIATLYRYFPSKTHLFTALLSSQVGRLSQGLALGTVRPVLRESPEEGIARLLVTAGRELLARPLLAQAMLHANNASVAQEGGVTGLFAELMLEAGGIGDPTPQDMRLVRLLEQAWYGILISTLNHHISVDEVEADTELACRLLLRDLSNRQVRG